MVCVIILKCAAGYPAPADGKAFRISVQQRIVDALFALIKALIALIALLLCNFCYMLASIETIVI